MKNAVLQRLFVEMESWLVVSQGLRANLEVLLIAEVLLPFLNPSPGELWDWEQALSSPSLEEVAEALKLSPKFDLLKLFKSRWIGKVSGDFPRFSNIGTLATLLALVLAIEAERMWILASGSINGTGSGWDSKGGFRVWLKLWQRANCEEGDGEGDLDTGRELDRLLDINILRLRDQNDLMIPFLSLGLINGCCERGEFSLDFFFFASLDKLFFPHQYGIANRQTEFKDDRCFVFKVPSIDRMIDDKKYQKAPQLSYQSMGEQKARLPDNIMKSLDDDHCNRGEDGFCWFGLSYYTFF